MSRQVVPERVVHVVVVSDRAAAGTRPDATGPELLRVLQASGFTPASPPVSVVPDHRDLIRERLCELARDPSVRLILTTGGTGAAPRDVTPEATRDVIERELPGFGEVMRARSRARTPRADGSRALAGTVGKTLIVNLPGSPQGAVECLGFVLEAAGHVLDLIEGAVSDCASPTPGAAPPRVSPTAPKESKSGP